LKYDIKIEKRALKFLKNIDKKTQSKIVEKIYALSENPYQNSKKLVGREAYRIRVGNYRVIYEIDDNSVKIFVINIGHRKDIYR